MSVRGMATAHGIRPTRIPLGPAASVGCSGRASIDSVVFRASGRLRLRVLRGGAATGAIRSGGDRGNKLGVLVAVRAAGEDGGPSEPEEGGSPAGAQKGGTGARVGSAKEWLQTILAKLSEPLADGPAPMVVLDFERPLVELDNRIAEVRRVAEENNVDVSEQIRELEGRATQLRMQTYSRLTPTQILQVARHPARPTFLDVVLNITDEFVELHGDRLGTNDPAIVCGLGTIDGDTFMLIGHQKGRNQKENVARNFGMPHPGGYRKALRFMQHADKFGFPILCMIDTPGAYAGKLAEDQGQGAAIAMNLREMFGLRVPVFTVVIGEGGSAGALAIGCGNVNMMLENSVYYVASPEAVAQSFSKSRSKEKVAAAAEALKITAQDMKDLGIIDEIIPEPLGGAHNNPMGMFPPIKEAVLRALQRYLKMTGEEIIQERHSKFRNIGVFEEFLVVGGKVEETRREREAAEPHYTRAGTRCTSPEEVEMIETIVDMDEKWDKTLATKAEWLKVPELPLGSRRGDYVRIMTVAARKGMNLEEVRYPEDIPKILGDQWDVEEQEPPSPPRGTQEGVTRRKGFFG